MFKQDFGCLSLNIYKMLLYVTIQIGFKTSINSILTPYKLYINIANSIFTWQKNRFFLAGKSG